MTLKEKTQLITNEPPGVPFDEWWLAVDMVDRWDQRMEDWEENVEYLLDFHAGDFKALNLLH